MNVRLGPISKFLCRRSAGWCLRCKTRWPFVRIHDTELPGGRGCFPLCAKCWAGLSISMRLVYYARLYRSWQYGDLSYATRDVPIDWDTDEWREIARVVMDGG